MIHSLTGPKQDSFPKKARDFRYMLRKCGRRDYLNSSGSCGKPGRVSFFELTVPEGGIPVLVEIPHAGLWVPDVVADELSAPEDAIKRDADIYVDRLCAHAPDFGAARLAAAVSRYVVDLNRADDDVDTVTVSDHPAPAGVQPRGVVWRATTDGRPVLKRPLTYQALLERLARFYRPYHDALQSTLAQLKERHGHVILLAAHSMPSRGRSLHTDRGAARADIVPGTQGRTTASARVIDLVDAHFRDAGLTVRHDEPYRGGFSTSHYGRPGEGVHAIQIELNRALYVNEQTFEPLVGDFERLQELLDQLFPKLGRVL